MPLLHSLLRRLKGYARAMHPLRITGYYHGMVPPRGRALVSYLPAPLRWQENDLRFGGHSNLWESVEIVRILNRLGYVVDAIAYTDRTFRPRVPYDVVFDIHENVLRFAGPSTRKLFHFTGSHPGFSNRAEQARVEDVRRRRGCELMPRRSFSEAHLEASRLNTEAADLITLVGNEVTRATFPENIRRKMRCVSVTGSYLPQPRDPARLSFEKREFMWFGGAGAVHKGLDLVLEAFRQMPELTLHVVGPYRNEQDFMRCYYRELRETPNIREHGYLYPASAEYGRIVKDVAALVFPSCSESTSAAAVTCMQNGFIPILSLNAGVDLTPERGVLLHECAVDEIMRAVRLIAGKTEPELRAMATAAQQYARITFSREQFSLQMEAAFRDLLAAPLARD